jgi:hypothetical protein
MLVFAIDVKFSESLKIQRISVMISLYHYKYILHWIHGTILLDTLMSNHTCNASLHSL